MTTNLLDRRKIKVGVLRGGPSGEYEISLQTGANVLKNLGEQYIPQDIFISRDGIWHLGGVGKAPDKILQQVDVVWNALHGSYGEDGKVQKILESFDVPFTGSLSFPSSIGINKELSKKLFLSHGYKTPTYAILNPKDNTRERVIELFQSFPQPSVIKPIASGSSVGITIAKDFPTFFKGIENAFRHGGKVIVEEYIAGRDAMTGVIDNGGGKRAAALFPVEVIKPKDRDFFDYESRGHEETRRIVPTNFSPEEKSAMQHMALTLHGALDLRHYSSFDFIVTPNRGIYILEVNTLPGLTAQSLFPASLNAVDISMPEFIDHVLTLALR